MANKSITMIALRQLIKLYCQGVSSRKITKQLSLSRTTVVKYIKKFKSSGFDYEDIKQLDDFNLRDLFEEEQNIESDRLRKLLSYFPSVEKELKRVGVTLRLLWHEYYGDHPNAYSYPQFCLHYRTWRKQSEVSMHIDHKAGDKMFVDYTGKHLEITDKDSGAIQEVEVFVAILGASQLTYVEVTPSQQKEDFITSIENALIYFGGVPRGIVTDNLKSAVTKASKYEPKLNDSFASFANYYGTTILPTRSYKPKDKALVEGAVKIVYNRIFAPLRNQVFFSIEELNKAIRQVLEEHHKTLFEGRDYSRKQLFEEIEKQALSPLPKQRYEIKNYAKVKVQKNGHIWFGKDKHYYSIPYRYTGKKVMVIYTQKNLEVYNDAYQRIASHQRTKSPHNYTTIKEHMPSHHKFVSDWNPDYFMNWAEKIGPDCKEMIEKILAKKKHPEQSYKICLGILTLVRKVGKQRLNKACNRALYYERYNYHIIKKILENGMDKISGDQQQLEVTIPFHENIRGKQYYR